jgi:hypothetical protein
MIDPADHGIPIAARWVTKRLCHRSFVRSHRRLIHRITVAATQALLQEIMTVGEDIRLDHYVFAHCPLIG